MGAVSRGPFSSYSDDGECRLPQEYTFLINDSTVILSCLTFDTRMLDVIWWAVLEQIRSGAVLKAVAIS